MRKTSKYQKNQIAARQAKAQAHKHPSSMQRLGGIVREDPARAAVTGDRLRIVSQILGDIHIPLPGTLTDASVFGGSVLALLVWSEGTSQVHGSACMVAPGIALCATHVIHDHVQALMSNKAEAMAIGFAPDGLQFWRLREITNLFSSDLTILGLEYAADMPASGTFNQLTLSTRVPAIGERVSIVGVIPTSPPATSTGTGDIEIDMKAIMTQGEVTQHYLDKRDSVMMPWSCIEVDCHTWGSMSGGPVFDQSGRLIGLLSSSLESKEENGPSWVSLLWPAIAQEFKGGWPPNLRGSTKTLQEMDPRICSIDGRDAVEHLDGPNGRQFRLRLTPL